MRGGISRDRGRALGLVAILTIGLIGGPVGAATPAREPRAPVAIAAAHQAFADRPADWPADDWWRAYGDAQLDALIAEGLRGSPSLAAALARVRSADALVRQAGAARAPDLAANASIAYQKQSYNNGIPAFIVPKGYNDDARATLDLGWDLDLWGKNLAALRAARFEARATRADAAAARLALSTSIALAYADLLRAYDDRDAAAQSAVVREDLASLTAQRLATGLDTRTASRQSDSVKSSAQADVGSIDETIAILRHRLAALLGAGPDRGDSLQRPAEPRLRPLGLPDNLGADLLGRRPDIVAARLRAEEAAQRIHIAEADFYPDINLAALIGAQSLTLATLTRAGSDIGSIGPATHLPLFDGGRLRAAVRGAEADYDGAVANYEQTVADALQDVADIVSSRRALELRLAQTEAAATAAEEASRLTRIRFEAGLASRLTLLTTQDQAVSARHAVAVLQARALTLDVSLVRALGGGYRAS